MFRILIAIGLSFLVVGVLIGAAFLRVAYRRAREKKINSIMSL